MAQEHEKVVAESLESVENQWEMEAELHEILSGEKENLAPLLDDPAQKAAPETDEETEHQQPAKKCKDLEPEADIRTLRDVLASTSLLDFQPSEKDSERRLIERVRQMTGAMSKFSTHMRLAEKLMSTATIKGRTAKPRTQNLAEHALALARAAHQCSGARQSRFSLWANFSDRVQAKAAEEAMTDGVKAIKRIGAPTTVEEGVIKHQLLVVKPAKASMEGLNPLRFATPTNVWRVARRTAKTGRKVYPQGRLPVEFLNCIHVVLLSPQDVGSNQIKLKGSQLGWHQFMFHHFLFC